MKSFLFLSLLLVFLSVPASGTRCFKKYKTCCFRYEPCGHHDARVRVTKPCPIEKCAPHCHRKCHVVRTTVARRVCKIVRVADGHRCRGRHYHPDHAVPHNGRGCKTVYKDVRRCYTKRVPDSDRVCKDVCARKCHVVRAHCEFFKIVRYVKFCAEARCSPFKTRGNTVAPAPYNGKPGKTIRVVRGKRIGRH